MNISNAFDLRGALSAVLAAAIVGISGLALDNGHIAAVPAGAIEVGQLTPVNDLLQVASLLSSPVAGHRRHRHRAAHRPARMDSCSVYQLNRPPDRRGHA